MAALVNPAISRELILASPIARPSSIATSTISALIIAEIEQLAKEGLWNIKLAG